MDHNYQPGSTQDLGVPMRWICCALMFCTYSTVDREFNSQPFASCIVRLYSWHNAILKASKLQVAMMQSSNLSISPLCGTFLQVTQRHF